MCFNFRSIFRLINQVNSNSFSSHLPSSSEMHNVHSLVIHERDERVDYDKRRVLSLEHDKWDFLLDIYDLSDLPKKVVKKGKKVAMASTSSQPVEVLARGVIIRRRSKTSRRPRRLNRWRSLRARVIQRTWMPLKTPLCLRGKVAIQKAHLSAGPHRPNLQVLEARV